MKIDILGHSFAELLLIWYRRTGVTSGNSVPMQKFSNAGVWCGGVEMNQPCKRWEALLRNP